MRPFRARGRRSRIFWETEAPNELVLHWEGGRSASVLASFVMRNGKRRLLRIRRRSPKPGGHSSLLAMPTIGLRETRHE